MGYPNEDEGPDEVTWPAEKAGWALHIQPKDCIADHEFSLWKEGEIVILANGARQKLEEIVHSVNAVPVLIAALEKIAAPGSGYTAPTHQAIARAALAKVSRA